MHSPDPDPLPAPVEVCWAMPSVASRPRSELPDIDDRLVEPEARFEMYDGELVHVSPADPPHATRHVQLAALLEAHTGPGFETAADMLTRTSKVDDIAPDVSVYPEDPDPTTGRRQLEHLAFEIASTQSLAHAGRKAAKLTGRGVRRVFAIDVDRSRALEWAPELGAWRELRSADHIDDPALEVSLPIEALIHAAKADDAVQRALIAKANPVLEAHVARHRDAAKTEGIQEGFSEGFSRGKTEGIQEGRAEGKAEGIQEGRAEGKAEALLAVLAARRVAVGDAERVRILGERDPAQLDRWLARAATATNPAELFEPPR
jgi:Uma2 family endonuclease